MQTIVWNANEMQDIELPMVYGIKSLSTMSAKKSYNYIYSNHWISLQASDCEPIVSGSAVDHDLAATASAVDPKVTDSIECMPCFFSLLVLCHV